MRQARSVFNPRLHESKLFLLSLLIAKCEKKLKELEEINRSVPMTEIKTQRYEERLNDLREKVMLKMMKEEGFELDDITLEMVEDRMAKQQDKPQ